MGPDSLNIGQNSGINLLEMQAYVWRHVCVSGWGWAFSVYVCGMRRDFTGGWGGGFKRERIKFYRHASYLTEFAV